MYWRPILSSPTSKTEYCEWRWRCLGASTDSRSGSCSTSDPEVLYLRISPCIGGQSTSKTEYCEWRWRCLGASTDSSRSSYPLIKLNIEMEVRKLQYIRSGSLSLRILPGIYSICRSVLSLIKLNIEMEGEMLVGSTHSSRYRSHSTSGPKVYLSGYRHVLEANPLIHFKN